MLGLPTVLLFVSCAAAFIFSVGILGDLFACEKQRRLSNVAVRMKPHILFAGFAAEVAPADYPSVFLEND